MNDDRFGITSAVVPLRMDGQIIGEAHVDRGGNIVATVADPAARKHIMEMAPGFSVGVGRDMQMAAGDPARFKATALRSFKLYALHDIGPVKAGQPVLVVHMDRGMVDCIPWPEGMFRIPANELAEQPPEKHKTKVPRPKDADRWLGDTFIAAEASDPLNKLAGAELLDDPAVLEGRRARVEPIPPSLELRLVVDKMFEAAERAGLITGTEHDGLDDDTLAEMIARRLGQRRSNLDEVYEAHGERFTLPADVVAELKGAAPLLLERADAEAVVALRAAAGTNARVRELEAGGIRRALDHLGSAREEDSLDRREQYRAEAERELERVL